MPFKNNYPASIEAEREALKNAPDAPLPKAIAKPKPKPTSTSAVSGGRAPKLSKVDADALHRQKIIAGWNQDAISNAKILVIGAGALGNELVKLLCQKGARHFTLVDFDEIVPANLNRCVFFGPQDVGKKKAVVIQRRVKSQFPAVQLDVWDEKVEEIPEAKFGEFDFAFSCLDNLGARVHLNAQCYGKLPLIDGGTTGFLGKVQAVQSPSACVECGFSKKDYDILWKKYSCVGDLLDWVDPKQPALASTTSIVAAVMANEFVRLAHEKAKTPIPIPQNAPKGGLVGKYWFMDGRTSEATIFGASKRTDCPVHAGA